MGTTPNTAAIYVRRSAFDADNTEADAFSRSLAAQERECLAWAEHQGLTVTEVYRDKTGTSASHLKTNRRPEMERALADIGTSYHTLIVWAFDRATRKGMAEAGSMLETIEKAGGRMVSVTDGVDTDDPTARLMLAIRAEMARDEMTKLSTRVNRGKDEQRRRGEYLGGAVQYGLIRDKDAEYGVSVDQEAAEVLRRAVDMLIAGSSLTKTCVALNADGHRTSTGASWTATTLRRVVRSPHMLGHRYYKAQDIYAVDDDGNRLVVHEPIINEATFRRVDKAVAARARVTGNSQRGQSSVKRHASLLGGITRCGSCQTTFEGNTYYKTISTGEVRAYGYYRCRSCDKTTIDLCLLDQHVTRSALLFLASLDPESPIVEEVGRRWLARFTPDQVNRHGELRDEIDALEGRHRELQANYYERGTMDTDVFERLDRKLAGDIADLRDELRDTPTPQADLSALFDLVQSSDTDDIVGPGSAWANLPDHERREIIRVLVDQVTITRSDDRHDIVGRTTVEFATESNVIDLANRSERILGKHVSRKVKKAS
jgi:DNA invertase Pin-like site-specific DNA recombinase/ribosomal protein L37AE/L43A|tara:strand:+ start:103 stop:1734 length:1632 start_codon:yes stop_codon:yes gene_type:complete